MQFERDKAMIEWLDTQFRVTRRIIVEAAGGEMKEGAGGQPVNERGEIPWH